MQLSKALELLWRHWGVGAALALLSQVLPRAGASLVRGDICVPCGAKVSEQAFTRLSFQVKKRKEVMWEGREALQSR